MRVFMRGTLTFENNTVDDFHLNLLGLILQLCNIGKIEFTKASKIGKDYIDLILSVHRESCEEIKYNKEPFAADGLEGLILKFQKLIQKLFEDDKTFKELERLGATKLDRALINNKFEEVKEYINSHEGQDIYKLAKQFRFMELAKDIYKEKFQDICQLTIKQNDKDIKLEDLDGTIYININNQNKIESTKSLAVFINGDGNRAWDYNYCGYEYENMKNLFNGTISYGTGSVNISSYDLIEIMELLEKKSKNWL